MFAGLRTARAVARSLRLYYGGRHRRADMHEFYSSFVKPGALVFDVGAHVGDRVGAFRRLGARVIAVEPQPALATTLRFLYGRDRMVAIEQAAIGREEGEVDILVNVDNPTVSTASPEFIRASQGAPGWEEQRWTKTIRVKLTTLEALIARHGMPSFIKLDVEGYEAEALAGLSRAPAALSFEFTTIQRDVAAECIARCTALGLSRFRAVLGESLRYEQDWTSADVIRRWLDALPVDANSGDIYAAA